MNLQAFRSRLIAWYERERRDLPWRRTRDPYAVWISEIMLQQTRVAAAVPYFTRFIERFPTIAALARAKDAELFGAWRGLGYYSRARNLRKAARQIAGRGEFPKQFETLLDLDGVGPYTAAAVASIAFGEARAAVDGNVRRVISRIVNDPAPDTQAWAGRLLDKRDPGRWNQAVMELGATVCVPRAPLCQACPVLKFCAAHKAGTQSSVPAKRLRREPERIERTLLVISRRGRVLLEPSKLVPGYWDLPEPFPGSRRSSKLGEFTHSITHRRFRFTVYQARSQNVPAQTRWSSNKTLLSIITSKALRLQSMAGG